MARGDALVARLRRLPPEAQADVLARLTPDERLRAAEWLSDGVVPSPYGADIASRIADPALPAAVRETLGRIVRQERGATVAASPAPSLLDRILGRRERR
ncbi:hypothetical protein [Sphingomonas sp. VNH70]|uniref:hypothetical protein n=1 Tax=Sphingomonas silueang TaxID=3156617 RepID=UPI0032B55AAB